ncbi:MAG: lysophospholipid acyltransferase family protein [Pseudomonadota bacterium]
MQTNRLISYWVVLRSLLATLSTSLSVINASFMRRLTRQRIDQLSRAWSSKVLKIARVSYEVFNPYTVSLQSGRSYIIMSNHASLYDIPLIIMSLPGSIRMIGKKELFKVPIWGRAMRLADFISIDRENRRQAIQDLQLAKEKMENGVNIWMAPEGTRSRTGKIQSFKKGGFMLALKTNAVIIPVGIRGADKILPPKTSNIQLNQKIEIHIGKPIDTQKYLAAQRDQLMQDVEDSIREAAQQVLES